MIIHTPYKEIDGDWAYLKCLITDEVTHTEKIIFYSVQKEYADYLVDEVADSFLLTALLPAMFTGQRIVLEHPISSSLFYNIETIVYLLSKAFKLPSLPLCNILIDRCLCTEFVPISVATGFSGGIDSLCTYINHTDEKCPDDFKITHLTLFNIGSYGNDYEQSHKDFFNDVKRASAFAQEVHKPLILVDSNIGELYTHEGLRYYSMRSTLCLSSAVLALQKLIRRYFISSSGTIDNMKLSRWDQYFYEDALVHLLSTDCTTIYISESDLNRVEKTKILANNPLAQKFLYVCAADIYNAKHGTSYKKDTAPNCSECIKCERTLLTLDFLGVLQKYAERFDLNKYNKSRQRLIDDVVIKGRGDHFKEEIYALMLEKGFKLSIRQRVLQKAYVMYCLLQKIKGKLLR